MSCPLCKEAGGVLVLNTPKWRVVRVEDEAGHPAYFRVIWNAHVAEFSDLAASEQLECLEAVGFVEGALRRHVAPTKVNLASLGNVVPHLHWHVIARYAVDRHFPRPIWAEPLRADDPAHLARLAPGLEAVAAEIAKGWPAGPLTAPTMP